MERSIHEMVLKNDYDHDEFAKEFSMLIMPELALVEARVMAPPRLKYHESGKEKSCNPSVGQWNMIGKRMVNGETIHNWACINYAKIPMDVVHQFLHDLVNMCNNIGMQFNLNPVVEAQRVLGLICSG